MYLYHFFCCITVVDLMSLQANIPYKTMFLYTRGDIGLHSNLHNRGILGFEG
jgi:hypothetical protein